MGTLKQLGLLSVCILGTVLLLGCQRQEGWGVLLWSTQEPAIPSGTAVPVYIRSNIEQVWVVGIPREYRTGDADKLEIPLAHLELVGSRRNAEERASAFALYALSYAETLQDGLPVREFPENNSRRVYRLKEGEILKILSTVEGIPPISTTGEPLPGQWYQVLTSDGIIGYCYSFRLQVFEYAGGVLDASAPVETAEVDQDLEMTLAKQWYPEQYGTMVSSGRIDLQELERNWRFALDQEAGLVRLYLPNLDRTFVYTRIRRERERTWLFEGTNLRMTLRSENVLVVQYPDESGAARSIILVTLPTALDTIMLQENERRNTRFNAMFNRGPVFSSTNYGTLSLAPTGQFTWVGLDLLVPHIVPRSGVAQGQIQMRLFLGPALAGSYTGACSFLFSGMGVNQAGHVVNFLYTLDDQGMRIEFVPEDSITGITVTRRAASPTVIYFTRNSGGT